MATYPSQNLLELLEKMAPPIPQIVVVEGVEGECTVRIRVVDMPERILYI